MDSDTPISGDQLVQDFRDALVALATMTVAKDQAEQSERAAVDYLNSASQGTILNPSFIPEADQASIAQASVDAHIKKVQAAQIENAGAEQLSNMQALDQQRYRNKRVMVEVLQPQADPVETLWFDKQHGYRTSAFRGRRIKGRVEEIMLEKNVMLVRMGWFSKLLYPARHFAAVYVINPEDVSPAVRLTIQ